MGKTKIEWADKTWNPIVGCKKISAGCANCYAERQAKRFAKQWGLDEDDPFRVTWRQRELFKPLHWKKSRIFVCSMGDLFHTMVREDQLDKVFNVMQSAEWHTFLILTKRPKRMREYIRERNDSPLPNIWLGVTAENQEMANQRIPILLDTPAAKHFVSVEPMLGPVDLTFTVQAEHSNNEGYGFEAIKGLDWVICGGESGPQARPMHPEWVRGLRDQCTAADVPFLFKQWGEWYPIDGDGVCRSDYDDIDAKVPPFCWVDYDGTVADNGCDPDALMLRIGKRKAGREIDGVVWDQHPGQSKPQLEEMKFIIKEKR